MSDQYTVAVEGISEPALVDRVERALRQTLESTIPSVPWRVVLRPAPVVGWWDLRVLGLGLGHGQALGVPAELLPLRVPDRLREALKCLVHAQPSVASSTPDNTVVMRRLRHRDDSVMSPA